MKSSKKKILIFGPILIAIIAFVGVYFYFNMEDNTTSLNVLEKRWLEKNQEKVEDFEIINDYPLYGMNGKGVFFEFITDLENITNMEFNKIPYLKASAPSTKSYRFRILDNEEQLTEKDLLIFEDSYTMIGTTAIEITDISSLTDITLGVLNSDASEITYYLKAASNITYKNYETTEELFTSLDNSEVNMIVVPNIMYLDETIDNKNYKNNYFFTDISKKIVLTLSDNDTKLNDIVKKYYQSWKKNEYVKEYNKEYLAYYIEKNNINDKTKADIISKSYVYGYIENSPYEVTIGKQVEGIAGEYINRTARLTDIEFTYQKYRTKEELQQAINKGEVDIFFNYYDFVNTNYEETISTFNERYVVLGKTADNHIVNTFESLKNQKISMLNNESLYNYFANNSRANITTYKTLDNMIKNAKDTMLVVDYEVYNHYRNSKFSKYEVLYTKEFPNNYKFMVKKENANFYQLFNYIINTNAYTRYRNNGLSNLDVSLVERASFEELYILILSIILVPLIILTIIYFYFKKKRLIKDVKKEDRRKYTDMLTSLKNRNYLNFNMQKWDESKIFPQAIIMVDLNNVKYVNDNYGHEAGDKLIIKAASILVNTQLENTEIIRTDGNEFLIYLVGYSEQQVDTYTKKLAKEFKDLPHGFGAAVGFSMIMDEIKTIDDAINEATLEMRTNKEEYK